MNTHPIEGGPHPPEHITKHFLGKELLSEEFQLRNKLQINSFYVNLA